MSLDKYQQAWDAEASQPQVKFNADSLAKEVQQAHDAFRSTIFWRDVSEVGTSVVMIPTWLVIGSSMALPWTWYLIMPALLWIAGFMLVDRRRHPQHPGDPGEPLLFYVQASLAQVEHQIWLLRNVFWWYLLPPLVPMLAFVVHVAWNSMQSWWGTLVVAGLFVVFLIAIYGWIYWVNQRAVHDQLEPRRDTLQKLIANVESEHSSEEASELTELVSALSDAKHAWGCWAENWNRIIPSWFEVALIIVPTLAGAYLGFRYPLADAGPVFFQSVVAAVIPFEIAFFSLWYLSYQRHKGQPLTGTGPARPNAPALVTIALITLISILAFAAIYAIAVR